MENPPNRFIYEWRYSAVSAGLVATFLLGVLSYLTGAWDPENAPWYFESGRAFIGMTLLVTLLPGYIIMFAIYGYRRSYVLAREVDLTHDAGLTTKVVTVPLKLALTASIAGALYALLFNIPNEGVLNFSLVTPADYSIAFGQLLIWTILFCFIALRFRIAYWFNQASQKIPIDIFETTSFRPFAQIGLIDVLTFSGGMVLSTVQSLDLSFRPDNYSKALVIIIPTVMYLAIYPMWNIHKRMLAMKRTQLAELNKRIGEASKNLDSNSVQQLEDLLQRRERVSNCATWPIDVAILQRLLFYIIIPPLAWIGAALVELVIDGFISG